MNKKLNVSVRSDEKNLIDITQYKLENLFKEFLDIIGADVNSEGLKDTPRRAAKYWMELTEGMRYTNEEIAKMYDKCFEAPSDAMVVEKDIDIFSHCEHHLALMYDMKVAIAYIPKNKVIGLSKLARISKMCAKRLQLQERIVQDIYEVLRIILETEDIYIRIEGKHGCMTARGIQSVNAVTVCQGIHGKFKTEASLRNEAIQLMKGDK